MLGSGPTSGAPTTTESKPESKVWFNDNMWWASMWNSTAKEFRIHRLNKTTHLWVDTGVLVDARRDTHSDTLWDGTKLYIASHEFTTGPGAPGRQLLLMRYSYTAATDTYTLDVGFPVVIGDCRTETMVIDKDSTGKVWAVWKQASRVYFAHSLASDTSWTTPAVVPGCTTDFDRDDICSVIRFGTRIGVMWSDQIQKNFYFTSHLDGASDATWSPVEIALAGEADDHLHLEAGSAGKVYAVVKNLQNQTKLLTRSTAGVWQQFVVCESGLNVTRARMLLDEPAKKVHVFYTVGPNAQGGAIYTKSSSIDTIVFEPGLGTKIMQDSSGLLINNATSTKQNVTAAMGQVILAANTSDLGNYWHHEVAPVSPGGPFTLASIVPGTAGISNTLTATGATPNATVIFYAGTTLGTSVVPRATCPSGITIGLAQPYSMLGSARVNASGVATLTITPPPIAAGKLYNFQMIEPNSCRASNILSDQL